MKLLAICIPNYERNDLLEKLLLECAEQLMEDHLFGEVQICVSDDCSIEDPAEVISNIQSKYPSVNISYFRYNENQGMDRNFYNSVIMAEAKYAWIIGNDDIPCKGGIKKAVSLLVKHPDADFIVTPFDIYNDDGSFVGTRYPFGERKEISRFNTFNEGEIDKILDEMQLNCALFDFLSNVIFKRHRWVQHGNMFENKMNSIFIQIYMNMQSLLEGAIYYYIPSKLIIQHWDSEVNKTVERAYRIFKGLYDVSLFFFAGKQLEIYQDKLVDYFCMRNIYTYSTEDISKELRNIDTKASRFLLNYSVRRDELVNKVEGSKICLYGGGKRGRNIISLLQDSGKKIEFIVDKSISKTGKNIDGICAINPITARELYKNIDYILITVGDMQMSKDIVDELIDIGLDEKVLLV